MSKSDALVQVLLALTTPEVGPRPDEDEVDNSNEVVAKEQDTPAMPLLVVTSKALEATRPLDQLEAEAKHKQHRLLCEIS